MRSTAAVLVGLALVATVPAPSSARTCDLCQLQLTQRTGPYRIVAAKEGAWLAKKAPRIRVTIINPGLGPIVLGDSPASSRVVLNSVTPYARARETIRTAPRGHTMTVPAGSRATLYARYPYQLGRPGVYRFNVSYGAVDSNILAYTVR
jgi:hypothetical protein